MIDLWSTGVRMHQHGQVTVIHGNKGNSASEVLERQVNSPGANRMWTESNGDLRVKQINEENTSVTRQEMH